MSMHFSDTDFQKEVMESKIPVLVDFFAEWCGPCKMMAPSIDKLAKEYEGKIKIGKLDVEASPIKSGEYAVQSIPTIILFKDGKVVGQEVGFKSEEKLRQMIEGLLK